MLSFANEARAALRVVRPHEWLLLVILLGFTYRYFWLMDDAFVYFRYVDNFLFLKRGLAFNPGGEYVEGYSSPAWLGLLIPLRSLRFDYYELVRGLSLVAATIYGGALIGLNRKLSGELARINFPLAASVAHYGIASHFSSGLESPLVQLCAPLYAWALLKPRSKWLLLGVACSPLVRPELAAIAFAFALMLLIHTRRLRGPVLWLLAMLFVINVAWLAVRVYLYADFLPNTFYLKDGSHVHWGILYLQNVEEAHHLYVVIAILAACAWYGRKSLLSAAPDGITHARSAMLLLAGLYTLYVVRVGGDMLYFRYAAFPVCLGLCASAGVCEAALQQALATRTRFRAAYAAAISCMVALYFGACYPAQLLTHPITLPTQTRKWHAIADPMWHRVHEQLKYTPARHDEDRKRLAHYARLVRKPLAKQPHELTGWCAAAYADYENYVVHMYGLTDATLARLPGFFARPGHKLIDVQAGDLLAMMRTDRTPCGKGMVAHWLAHGRQHWLAGRTRPTPGWVVRNGDALQVLEQKTCNRHDFAENLRLAMIPIKLH